MNTVHVAIPGGASGWYRMPSLVDYFAARYESGYVEAICTGAHSDVAGRAERFPVLEPFEAIGLGPRRAAGTLAVLWAHNPDIDLAAVAQAALKDDARRKEEREGKRERMRDQPWRKQHA